MQGFIQHPRSSALSEPGEWGDEDMADRSEDSSDPSAQPHERRGRGLHSQRADRCWRLSNSSEDVVLGEQGRWSLRASLTSQARNPLRSQKRVRAIEPIPAFLWLLPRPLRPPLGPSTPHGSETPSIEFNSRPLFYAPTIHPTGTATVLSDLINLYRHISILRSIEGSLRGRLCALDEEG